MLPKRGTQPLSCASALQPPPCSLGLGWNCGTRESAESPEEREFPLWVHLSRYACLGVHVSGSVLGGCAQRCWGWGERSGRAAEQDKKSKANCSVWQTDSSSHLSIKSHYGFDSIDTLSRAGISLRSIIDTSVGTAELCMEGAASPLCLLQEGVTGQHQASMGKVLVVEVDIPEWGMSGHTWLGLQAEWPCWFLCHHTTSSSRAMQSQQPSIHFEQAKVDLGFSCRTRSNSP